ncbi:smad anchor for receptor activation isoform X3 [Calliopsis andreniformis]|uniref:smad anchor for receptor activation isoform X3 n=1 Tax=Calliopsis andreniformis TaxID=337506 RepID=UPI003FCD60AF
MEKFAVDLDKVLDDFEFNEDCAEQIASVNPPTNNASSSTIKCNLEPSALKNYNYLLIDPRKANKEFDIISPLERHKDSQQTISKSKCVGEKNISDSVNYSKDETIDNTDSVNHFYTQESACDDKLTQKQPVPSYDTEQVPLTVYNDISQKLMQKQQNGSSSPKIDNRYDKKLNQFNLKPSVSNVFSSLNEYINAPPGSSDCIHSVLDEEDVQSSTEHKTILHESEASQLTQSSVKDTDKSIAFQQTDVINGRKEAFNPGHQEIPVPVSLELPVACKISIEEDTTKNILATSSKETENETELSKNVSIIQADSELNTDVEIVSENPHEYSLDHVHESSKVTDQRSDSKDECVCTQNYCGDESLTQLEESNKQLDTKNTGFTDEYENNVTPKFKPLGFSNINDLSEDELTKYLTELEAEEKLNEESKKYENVSMYKSDETISGNVVQSTSQDQKDQYTVIELPKPTQKELDDNVVNASLIDHKSETVDKEISKESLEKQSHQHNDDQRKENKYSDILDDTNSKEFKLLHTNEDDTVKHEDMKIHLSSESECMSNTKSINDTQEHCTYHSNIVQGSLSSNKTTETQFEEQKENSVQNNQVYELNMQSSADNSTEDKNSMTPEVKIVNDKGKHCDDTMPKSMDISTRSSISDTSDESEKPIRPQTLDIVLPNNTNEQTLGSISDTSVGQPQLDADSMKEDQGSSPDVLDNSLPESNSVLGKQPPFWVPDSYAQSCMLCDVKFTVLKRRHHCRACGKVLCNKCCSMKYKLEYQGNIDSRVCVSCYQLLTKVETEQAMGQWSSNYSTCMSNNDINSPQLAGGLPPPPTVMVPVGVLKREGGTKNRPEVSKSVMFSDGIRPGCDLTELDMSWDLKPSYRKSGNKRIPTPGSSVPSTSVKRQNLPRLDPNTECYVPQDANALPPTVTIEYGEVTYHTVMYESFLYKTLKSECRSPVMFAINRNLYAYVKILNLNCCINKTCWNITSKGLACVGQDEVVLLVETLPDETQIPKDLLIFINQLYLEAIKGNTISELGFSLYQGGNLLGSREHAGFLFIRQTLQCLQKIILPPAPYLFGLLIHRWETPWAKVFPLRLVLRLGAEYRYYPCPLFSVRFRDALYFEIGHTVMKVLADFRNFGYTLPGVRGLTIHLRNRMTDVMFPKNRYDQVIKGLNNSNDHVLAYASNFSILADSHLVCIQTNTGDESSYQTQAISINNKPRTVTGTSFIVINGALKSSMGLSAKSSIVEDGLMVEIMPEKMEALKAALKNMQDFSIGCGRQGAPEPDETVNIKWVDNDVQFNLGVKSPIDGQQMDGVPSIRVHNGTDYKGTRRFIRWTEVFIIKSDDHPNGVHDPVDINKLSGNIAKATCTALVKLLDLLATAGLTKLAVRTTIHPDNVGYEAGSEGMKLAPIYMNSLDNELIQVLHKAAQSSQDTHTVLELIFYILDN